MNFKHQDIEFDFEIENVTIKNPLYNIKDADWENAEKDLQSAMNMMIIFEFEDAQSMHHFESIIKEHSGDHENRFHMNNEEFSKTACHIPIKYLNGLEISIDI